VVAVIVVEQASYFASTGDPLFRLHATRAHNQWLIDGVSPMDSDIIRAPPEDVPPETLAQRRDTDEAELRRYRLLRRLFIRYPRRMVIPHEEVGIHSVVTLAIASEVLIRFRRDRRVWLLFLLASVPWLYLNFGSSSLTSYVPIPVFVRYIAFVYPPLFLLVGWGIAEFISRGGGWRVQLAVTVITVVLISGFLTGLAMRATGHRTHHVAVLRVIAYQVQARNISSVCIDVHPGMRARWLEILRILTGGDVPPCTNGQGLTVGSSPLGLPFVANLQEPAAAPAGPR
jgi:hypothetical protein